MGEKEKNGKTWREKQAESFALKFYWLSPLYSACLRGLITKPLYKLQKKPKLKANTRDKFGRKSKREQKVKTGRRKSNANSGSGRMVNSVAGSQFCSCSNFLVFSSLLSF